MTTLLLAWASLCSNAWTPASAGLGRALPRTPIFVTSVVVDPDQPKTPRQRPTDDIVVGAAAAAAAAADEWDAWDERTDWALEDSVPHFTLDTDRVVLWRRMSLEVPELLTFTPTELRSRWLFQKKGAATQLEEEPPCLEEWACTAPGRYEGFLHNLPSLRDGSLRAAVEHDPERDAELAGTAAPEGSDGHRRWVRTREGVLFELGRPRAWTEVLDEDRDVATDAAALLDTSSASSSLEMPASMGQGANELGKLAQRALLAGGALAAVGAAAYFVLGHHHVDVSVFIV
jgi:hypothetical protein